jgi:hypothetical protein
MGDLSLERLSVYKTAVTTEEKKLESMNKNERQKLLLEKKLNLEKLRLERQKLKEDKEEEIMILSMDLSKYNPLLRITMKPSNKRYWLGLLGHPHRPSDGQFINFFIVSE